MSPIYGWSTYPPPNIPPFRNKCRLTIATTNWLKKSFYTSKSAKVPMSMCFLGSELTNLKNIVVKLDHLPRKTGEKSKNVCNHHPVKLCRGYTNSSHLLMTGILINGYVFSTPHHSHPENPPEHQPATQVSADLARTDQHQPQRNVWNLRVPMSILENSWSNSRCTR